MFARVSSTAAAEDLLFAQLEAALKARETENAGPIGPPLRIMVPSRSLRDHLARAWLLRLGRAQLGVAIQTHHTAALEVLERCGEPVPRGDLLVPLWAESLAAEESALRTALGGFAQGLSTVTATVRDLLDAGYRPHHEDAAREVLYGVGSRAERERALAVLRVAARLQGALERVGLAHRAALFERAEARLQDRGPDFALPSFAIWIYGFADATGATADWLASLVRHRAARLIVESPLDPGDPERCEATYSEFFLARMAERTGLGVPPKPEGAATPRLNPPQLLAAPGAAAELRAVATRIRAALDAGTPAEEIGVVARNFDDYRPFLGAEFERLGIPASTRQVAGYSHSQSRRFEALRVLLEGRGEAPIDAWLGADARAGPTLAVALHRLGVPRLGMWAKLELESPPAGSDYLRLPVRLDAERSLPLGFDALASAQARARQVLELLEGWPDRALPPVHHAHYAELIRNLGLTHAGGRGAGSASLATDVARTGLVGRDGRSGRESWEAREGWHDELPEGLELARTEWQRLLLDALEAGSPQELLGAGGGVQVLPVMAARARRFRELFAIGLNRDRFPRSIADDPLIPDTLRRELQVLIPDLPIKGRGRDEERHLFASLCGAAERCTLSWATLSEEGRELLVSPLVTRLQLEGRAGDPHEAPPLRGARALRAAPALDALEHATRVALSGPRRTLDALWADVFGERNREVEEILGPGAVRADPSELGSLAAAALEQLNPGAAPGAPLGPFLGLVEPGAPAVASEEPEFFITSLDQMLRCPWQRFLRRELRLEPVPDCLADLPAPSPRLRGSTVHRVLQRIVETQCEAMPADLATALRQKPRQLEWPTPAELDAIVTHCAVSVAREAGVRMPGFAELLARSVRGDLARAAALEWVGDAAAAIYGVELQGSCVVPDRAGRPRRIGFRADRVDRRDGELCLVEYKTGRSFARGVGEATRLRKLGAALREGEGLQLPVYVSAAVDLAGEAARAQLVFLREGLPTGERVTYLRPTDTEVFQNFDAATALAMEALDAGARIPRLIDRDPGREPERCASCEVSLACLRGESGRRVALAAWRDRGRPRSRAERAAAELLGAAPRMPAGNGAKR